MEDCFIFTIVNVLAFSVFLKHFYIELVEFNSGLQQFMGFNAPMGFPNDYQWYPPYEDVSDVISMKLPDGSGIDVLNAVKSEDPSVPVIMMTAYGEVETAVEAMKSGAYDFILKPYALEKLRVTITNALETHRLKNEIAYLKSGNTGRNFFKQFCQIFNRSCV